MLDWRVLTVNWTLSGQHPAAVDQINPVPGSCWCRCSTSGGFSVLLLDLMMCLWLQAVRMSGLSRRMCFSGLSSELQPLPSERAGPELQSSRRLRSEAAVCWTGGSTLQTGHTEVEPDNKSSKTQSVVFFSES